MSAHTFHAERPARTRPATATAAAPAPAGRPASGHPSLTTTVPKEFVHRASIAEVLLTDWQRTGEDRFTVSAQWPRGHSFFTPVEDRHDPLIAAETIRQSGLLLAHAEFAVPLDHSFVMHDLTLTVDPAHLLVGPAPASLTIDVTCCDITRRRGRLASLRYRTVLRRAGHVVATGDASCACTPPAVYRRLRGERRHHTPPLPLTAPTAPQTVGRTSPTDVVLTPLAEPGTWQLRVDTRHPVLFDHPLDHIPGMLLLEAARQATSACLGRPSPPLSLSTAFTNYAELDAPCRIQARRVPAPGPTPHETVLITCHQNNRPVFHSTVTVAPPTT
jgi:hypothetical protein